ncbi:MAG: trehalose utilization protein ThuA [Opitutae bacterium]|jgi:trehalose utilization protein|nr:trehalose utilization protein ThuA [Opitutae bacterium]|tara:strand:+ start:731 stop:1462 length:732 start_codon:yes stop_codon:yes gene_type:complete
MNVLIWNEFRHEKRANSKPKEIYPDGIHTVIAGFLEKNGMEVRTVTLDDFEHGCSVENLEWADVLIWWGHMAHGEVQNEIVERIHKYILRGLGLVALHSAHFAKIFIKTLGTGCTLSWREAGEKERLWNVNPSHPISQGLGSYIELQNTEMYGEPFDIPEPDELVFISWFEGGEVFRSGACWRRGRGKIFYFRPGHETYPIYYDLNVQKVISNGVHWAKSFKSDSDASCPNIPESIETIGVDK